MPSDGQEAGIRGAERDTPHQVDDVMRTTLNDEQLQLGARALAGDQRSADAHIVWSNTKTR